MRKLWNELRDPLIILSIVLAAAAVGACIAEYTTGRMIDRARAVRYIPPVPPQP